MEKLQAKIKEVQEVVIDKEKLNAIQKFFRDFKKFALKGDMIDLLVAVVIGNSIKDLVKLLVNDIILPPISIITGRIDFSQLYINLSDKQFDSLADAEKAGVAVIKYGEVLSFFIEFLITAFIIYLIIRFINKIRKPVKKPKTTTKCPYCYSIINKNAVKCPYCTSQLAVKKDAKKKA